MEIPFPLGGLNDLSRKSAQAPGTTTEGVNVRSIDRATGKARGAQRPGYSKYCDVQVSASARVAAIGSVVYDARKLDYTGIEPTASNSVFTYTSKDAGGVKAMAQDSLGNIYAVFGNATVIKVNPDGRKVWERALPTPDKTSVCRAICVGGGLELYVATSTGKSTDDARIWRIDQLDDDETEIAWEYEADGFSEGLAYQQGQLFSAENQTRRQRSYLVVYDSLEANLSKARNVEIPYPVHALVVRSDGTAYTAHPPFANRGLDPQFPNQTERTVDWTPQDLDDWERRIWCWFKASDLQMDDGDPVLSWESSAGKRILALAPQREGPTFNAAGLAGGPTVSFTGDSSSGVTRAAALISGTNKSVQAEYADQQNTIIPGYKGAQFAVFIVVRVTDATDSGVTPSGRSILAQENTAGSYSDQIMAMDSAGGSPSAGRFQWVAQTTTGQPGAGSGGLPFPYNYNARDEDTLLISAVYTSGLPPLSTSTLTVATGSGSITCFSTGVTDSFRVSFPSSYVFQAGDVINFTSLPGSFTSGGLSTGTNYAITSAGSPPTVILTFSAATSISSGDAGTCSFTITRQVSSSNTVGCLLRVNGNPVDRFYGEPFETFGSGYSGTGIGVGQIASIVNAAVGYEPAKMDLAEFLVIHNPDYPERDTPVTAPGYPRTLGTGLTSTPDSSTVVLATDALYEITKIEGYLAHAHGISHLLPTTRTTPSWTGVGFTNYDFGAFPHPYSRFRGPPRSPGETDTISRAPYLLQSKEGMVVKWAADSGKMVWVATGFMPSSSLGPAQALGGIGYGLAIGGDEDDEIALFSYGPPGIGLGGTVVTGFEDFCLARKIKDNGDEPDFTPQCTNQNAAGTSGGGLWAKTWFDLFTGTAPLANPYIWEYGYGKMCSDGANNAYIPVALGLSAACQLVVVSSNGAYELTPNNGFVSTTSAGDAYAVLAAAPEPEYEDDDWDGTSGVNTRRAEFFYLGYKNPTSHCDLEKIRFATLSSTTGSPRQLVAVCVAGGDIKKFTSSAITTPTGGTAALDAASEVVSMTQAFGEVFFTDGTQYKVYNPKTDEVSTWRSKRPGGIPEKCKGIELWNGRLVLYRSADAPQGWFMSAFGNPYDFDLQPPVITKTMAVAGSGQVGPGLVPDIINTFVPYTDDLAYWGCDHAIFRQTGDPADDGKIDLVTDVTGMGFGRCWAKDPNGVLYFWGSRGGVYRMIPGSMPERMTLNRIERRLTELNLATFRVEMAWDTQNNGLNVFFIPWSGSGQLVSHFFWDAQADAWWEDRICESSSVLAPGRQPSCVYVLDGDDPADRVLLTGCFDGYIRKVDRSAKSDDGQPIDSRVLMGPFTGEDNSESILWGNPILVLSDQQDGCQMQLLASADPDVPTIPIAKVDQGPGRNMRALIRARGAYVWVRLRSNAVNSSWAFESLTIEMLNSGAARAR